MPVSWACVKRVCCSENDPPAQRLVPPAMPRFLNGAAQAMTDANDAVKKSIVGNTQNLAAGVMRN